MSLYSFFWFFIVYSFLGWCVEVVYTALTKGKAVNRGFLNGPVCPIYGFGMIAILGFFDSLLAGAGDNARSAPILFTGGIFITTCIELFGGWILNKLFHIRWWDYSDKPFNFYGYICPEFSFYWGLGTVFVYRIVHPTVAALTVKLFPVKVGVILLAIFYSMFFADIVVTVATLIGLNKRLKELDRLKTDMRRLSNELSEKLGENAIKKANVIEHSKVQAALYAMEAKQEISLELESKRQEASDRRKELIARKEEDERRYAELREKIYRNRVFGVSRLVKSFPASSHNNYSELFELIKEHVNKRSEHNI